MATESATKSHTTKQPTTLTLVDGDPFLQRMKEVYDTIAQKAYDLFESRGHQDGHDMEDWFRAELEFLNPVPVEISESDDELIVRADMPGFRDRDIEVRVEPRRLIITGKREQHRDEKKRKTVYSERRSNEVFRTVDFSEEVDPDKVKANLQDGTLEIALPKARPARKVPVTTKAA